MLWRFAAILLIAVLSGCASTGDWSSDAPPAKDSRAAKAKRVDLKSQSVSDMYAPSSNLWIRIRDGFEMEPMNTPLEIEQVRWLSARPDYVHRSMARSSRYLFYIVQEVNARNMPTEIALLPFVESAFVTNAKSSAKAMGLWQFMPATGKDFQLTQNVFRDERRDVLLSTDAALDYLQRLHKQFGSWDLALAAYNWGAGNIAKAQKRNLAAGLPTDYLSLKMPNETRNYVPKLMAYRQIVLDPQAYGIVLPELENHPYFVAVDVGSDIDVDLAIKLSEIPQDEFHSLNPSFNKPVILSNANQQILLPFGHAEIFQENLKKYTKPLSSWTAVRVTKTEPVDKAAKTLGVNVDALREVNAIPKGMRIRAGSTVLIPKTSQRSGDIPLAMAENGSLSLDKPKAAGKKCAKGAKCSQAKPSKASTKGKSSKINAASQHKSASTGLAKSAKNGSAHATSSTAKVSSSKGVGKIQ
ncbi:MAG: lytic transglycosylase [Polynucleobacter sp. 24-46-87]|jgi:membrane-bound lytic murein transglycosylase D|uniref:transglycosylase SLT domain-containing protein n=1 Tax=unclassified Polynucleobacter TaxID=2640945 RepID=UPI000BCF85B7|nr:MULTISPECIES: transglycosylase SLT domain-containing protein [unclassified Polynucleobacter]OYY17613.1 MAG: lytic transglycosylase [Polynucleobacter sp. 35-46-11]OZA15961.1 MAG: lytic transglycosylase [Polynucleobacter sp. 24-46-87]OZA78231.1 MAG: lytic transglycosylase [Polynucleobacter sp. 39-46-10]